MVAFQKDRAALKGAEGEGFIQGFSCWDAAGWEGEAEEGLQALAFRCWAVPRDSVEVEFDSSEDGVELFWSGETHWDGAV